DHKMRRFEQQFPVLERTRLAFVSIHDHILGVAASLTNVGPLLSGWNARASHSAERRNIELLDEITRILALNKFLRRGVSLLPLIGVYQPTGGLRFGECRLKARIAIGLPGHRVAEQAAALGNGFTAINLVPNHDRGGEITLAETGDALDIDLIAAQ